MSNDLRAAEMRVSDLVGEVASRDDALSRLGAEATDLRRVVAGLDADRDALQVWTRVCVCVCDRGAL